MYILFWLLNLYAWSSLGFPQGQFIVSSVFMTLHLPLPQFSPTAFATPLFVYFYFPAIWFSYFTLSHISGLSSRYGSCLTGTTLPFVDSTACSISETSRCNSFSWLMMSVSFAFLNFYHKLLVSVMLLFLSEVRRQLPYRFQKWFVSLFFIFIFILSANEGWWNWITDLLVLSTYWY